VVSQNSPKNLLTALHFVEIRCLSWRPFSSYFLWLLSVFV